MSIKPKVYVTRQLPEPGPSILSNYCHVKMNKDSKPVRKSELLNNVSQVDSIVCMIGDNIDSEVIASAGNRLKLISCYSAGYDHVDIDAAKKYNIVVTNTPNILSDTTADLTFALIFALSRNIVKGDDYVRSGKWKFGWTPDLLLGHDVYGKVLGIVGLGEIGTKVGKRGKAFDMNVIYYSRVRKYHLEAEFGFRYVEFDELLRESDIISIHVDLNKDTVHLVSRNELKKMKNSAMIINTSRGKVVNEIDLISALSNRTIAGAALDVYEEEPISESSSLSKMSNTVLLPHIGSATYETRKRMAEMAANNVINFFRKTGPLHRVN
ncbi:MAG TPA: D-glycerate dehydrogenase [Nitrososphaeraceae archaeon]